MQGRVDELIANMKPGAWFKVDKMCREENREKFLSCIRKCMSTKVDHWRYEISNDNNTISRNLSKIDETFTDWLNKGAKKPSLAKD